VSGKNVKREEGGDQDAALAKAEIINFPLSLDFPLDKRYLRGKLY
jgi:hypothetical protein